MEKNQPWVEKHRPETIDDIQGNNSDLKEIQQWAEDFPDDRTPQLLHGEPGVGKTSTAYALANDMGWDVVEVNASSARKTADLRRMRSAIQSGGDGENGRLVLLDEVDSWSGHADKTTLYDALDAPANPVIMTANEEWEVPDGIKSRSESREFKLNVSSRRAKLREIAEAEGLDADENEIDKLAERPDLRSAIGDLQLWAEGDLPPSTDDREWEEDEWDMLDRLMTGGSGLGDATPPDALIWLDENLSCDYRGLELAWSYHALALADRALGMAQDRGYRHWRYAAGILGLVGELRRTEPYRDSFIYGKSFPEWFRHKEPKATGEKSEAKLYRALKDYGGEFRFAGSFVEFRETVLPILEALDDEEKYELAYSYGLGEEVEVLDVTESEYRSWVEAEEPEAGEWTGKRGDAAGW